MVKIKDLTNKQLVEQLTKYFKLIDTLTAERQKRLDAGGEQEELLTETEKKELVEKKANSHAENQKTTTAMFQLSIDDEEINDLKENQSDFNANDEEDELESATRLINLAKEMEQLRSMGKGEEVDKIAKEQKPKPTLKKKMKVKKKKTN